MSNKGIWGDHNTNNSVGGFVTTSPVGGNKVGMDIAISGSESLLNSSTTPLSSGSTFTGTGEQNNFPQVGSMVYTDQPGTLYFDFSNDGTNWDSTFPVGGFRISASVSEFHSAVKLGRYFRARLVNDNDGDQTFLRMTTYYGIGFIPSNAPLNQALGIDSDAISVRPTIFSDEAVVGKRSGVRHFTKFGYKTNLTAANGEETVWETTENFTPLTSASTFTITYNSATDGLGTTGALTLFFDYIDSSGLWQNAAHVLSNTGSDVTSFSGLGINRVALSSSGSAQVNTNAITITATTGGSKQAIIPALSSVTQQAIFFTDSNSYAVIKEIYLQAIKPSGGSAKILIKAYAFNRNVSTRYELFRSTIDTSAETSIILNKPVGIRLTPTDVFYFVADTDTNNAEIAIRFSLLEYKIS